MLTELDLSQSPQVMVLFEAFPYDPCELQRALNDANPRIFADDATSPQASLLCPQGGDVAFAAGNADFAAHLMGYVLGLQDDPPRLRFLSLPNDAWREKITAAFPNCFYEKHRISHTIEDPHKTENWQSEIPPDCGVQRIDQALAEQIRHDKSLWFGDYWPDVGRFVSEGMGYCLLQNSRVVSLAYSPSPVSRLAEIVVETDQEFRGRDYAGLCCAPFIQECLSRHIEPFYSADRGYTASLSVAKKVDLAMRYIIAGCRVSASGVRLNSKTVRKSSFTRSFVAGAISAPLLVCVLLFASARLAAGELPVAIISIPFLAFTTQSGRTISVTGVWLWMIIALAGGISFSLVVGVIRIITNNSKGS
jgi:hypothetical protein